MGFKGTFVMLESELLPNPYTFSSPDMTLIPIYLYSGHLFCSIVRRQEVKNVEFRNKQRLAFWFWGHLCM